MEASNGTESTPTWLDKAFLERALRSRDEEDVEVTSYQVTRATADGDNYSSLILRVKVNYVRNGVSEMKSIILKAEQMIGKLSEATEKANIFPRERTVLSKIVPKIRNLINEATSHTVQSFAAECLYSHFGSPGNVLVLEDLKEAGFKMAERTEGLDKKHCLLVLNTLAKYHAGSVVLHKLDPKLFDEFCVNPFSDEESVELMEPMFGKGIKYLAQEMENWPEFDPTFSEKLHKISVFSAKYIIDCRKKQDGCFNVFRHGDLWLNNMMFKYSEADQVQEVSDAALDLQYFLHTSPSIELMSQHLFLLEEYHRTLGETFSLLGYKHLHPSLKQLNQQVDKLGLYAVIMSCTVLALVLSDRTEVPNLEKVWENKKGIHYSTKYRKALQTLLPIFEKKGWLNL
ncbi:hypothetical protein L9F63_023855 [Diploptera punctata]|uniref:CHK kinase-like domain-containing protein n=1 Tax=Diploptera punctata TaxID=6984 RepID=A0AAD7ZHV9_DIPPU|nr:hypothetical protein L9F63_023855 [Diploptera punctata]